MTKQQEFNETVLPYYNYLWKAGAKYFKERDDIDDVVQEALCRAYRYWDSFERGSNLKAWLSTILTSVCINTYRRNKRYNKNRVKLGNLSLEDTSCSRTIPIHCHDPKALQAFDNIEFFDIGARIKEEIANLPKHYSKAAWLFFIKHMGYYEIADYLGIKHGTVKSRIHRSREILQKNLADLREIGK